MRVSGSIAVVEFYAVGLPASLRLTARSGITDTTGFWRWAHGRKELHASAPQREALKRLRDAPRGIAKPLAQHRFLPSFTIALARASTCSAGTSNPFTPGRITSRGPFGQSKLMQAAPQVIASISTKGKPSYRELRTKIPHSEYREYGSSENGAKNTRRSIRVCLPVALTARAIAHRHNAQRPFRQQLNGNGPGGKQQIETLFLR